jgi:hypothetical protein
MIWMIIATIITDLNNPHSKFHFTGSKTGLRFMVNVSDYHAKKRTLVSQTIDGLVNGSFF